MSIYEYDEEKTMRMFREEGYEDGERNGKNQAQEYLDNYIAQNS